MGATSSKGKHRRSAHTELSQASTSTSTTTTTDTNLEGVDHSTVDKQVWYWKDLLAQPDKLAKYLEQGLASLFAIYNDRL